MINRIDGSLRARPWNAVACSFGIAFGLLACDGGSAAVPPFLGSADGGQTTTGGEEPDGGRTVPSIDDGGEGGEGGADAPTDTPDAGGDAAPAMSGADGGGTLSGCTPAAGVDYRWACWPMPNPKGSGLPHAASYTDMGDGTVKDEITQLLWQKTAPAQTYTWSDAISYCANLALAGHVWHLPTRIELLSITDYTKTGPAIDETAFPKTPSAFFWTSSPWVVSSIASKPQLSWIVNFYEGLTSNAGDRTKAFDVRCVSSERHGPLPVLYAPIATGEVRDTQTGLVWATASAPSASANRSAETYCSALQLNGHTWRMPSVKELSTLVDEEPPISKVSPAINTMIFPDTAANTPYWTSSLFNNESSTAHPPWVLNFLDGFTGYASTTALARCVR